MSGFLLDVNVIIAILDPEHDFNLRARTWFESAGAIHWITSPTVENGVVRILSGTAYPRLNWTPAMALESLESLALVGMHEFVQDSISFLTDDNVVPSRLLSSKQVTDTYLLALAVHHDAILATLDSRLSPIAVKDGRNHLLHLA